METNVKTNSYKSSNNGLLEKRFTKSFWNSKITSANVTGKERWLGFVLGPFGIMVIQSIVNSYFNQYLTDVLGFTVSKGAWIGVFMVVFPFLSKIFDAITNVIMAKIIDRTACKQGKLRPWFILSLPIVVISAILLFWIPVTNIVVQAIWVAIAYNLFYSVGYTMWYMSYELSAALSTRNIKQRSGNSMAGQITKNIGTGIVSILFPTILTIVCAATKGNNQSGYLLCVSILCCIAIPLTFIQYFYTRERITEERRNQYGVVNGTDDKTNIAKEASFMEQFKACVKDKYWIMLIVMVLVYQVLNAMKNVSQVYYSGWIVNGNAYGQFAAIQAKFTMIAMAPMGPGLILLLPLFRKLGRRKVIIMGSVLTLIGSAIALFNPGSTAIIYGGTAIASIGTMTFMYSLMTFIGDCIDHVEYSQGMRTEGLTAAFVGFAHCVSNGIGQGMFNLGLAITKYATPEKIGVSTDGIALYADQTAAASNWINICYQGSFLLMGALFFILFLFFFDIEKRLPTVHNVLQQKKKEECEALGIEYIPSQILEKQEKEKQKLEAEENRIKELKEYCIKKGKDFEQENNKFLEKRAKKEAKKKQKINK